MWVESGKLDTPLFTAHNSQYYWVDKVSKIYQIIVNEFYAVVA